MFNRQLTPLATYRAERIAIIKPSAWATWCTACRCFPACGCFPNAHLAWIVNRGYAPLLEGHPHLDAIVPFDRGLSEQGPGKACSDPWEHF